jgi:hypothetical protein
MVHHREFIIRTGTMRPATATHGGTITKTRRGHADIRQQVS